MSIEKYIIDFQKLKLTLSGTVKVPAAIIAKSVGMI